MISSPASESLEHARFAVVDVETTGVRAQVGGRILEVAVAILEGGTIHLAFQALLDPGTPIPLWVARRPATMPSVMPVSRATHRGIGVPGWRGSPASLTAWLPVAPVSGT